MKEWLWGQRQHLGCGCQMWGGWEKPRHALGFLAGPTAWLGAPFLMTKGPFLMTKDCKGVTEGRRDVV